MLIAEHGHLKAALYFACKHGDLLFVQDCLSADKKDDTDVDWEKLIEVAYRYNHRDIASIIATSGKVTLKTQIESACKCGPLSKLQECLSKSGNQDQNIDWNSMLVTAYIHQHQDIVTFLQESGHFLFPDLMRSACEHGDMNFVQKALFEGKHGDHDVDCSKLSDIAIQHGHTGIAQVIMEHSGLLLDTQLMSAAEHGDLVCVQDYLSKGCHGDHDVDWQKVINIADKCGHSEIVECVVQNATVSLQAPLKWACERDSLQFVSSCLLNSWDDGLRIDMY
jgi:hypothetical protein